MIKRAVLILFAAIALPLTPVSGQNTDSESASDENSRVGSCENACSQMQHFCEEKNSTDMMIGFNASNNAKRNVKEACEGTVEADVEYNFESNKNQGRLFVHNSRQLLQSQQPILCFASGSFSFSERRIKYDFEPVTVRVFSACLPNASQLGARHAVADRLIGPAKVRRTTPMPLDFAGLTGKQPCAYCDAISNAVSSPRSQALNRLRRSFFNYQPGIVRA